MLRNIVWFVLGALFIIFLFVSCVTGAGIGYTEGYNHGLLEKGYNPYQDNRAEYGNNLRVLD